MEQGTRAISMELKLNIILYYTVVIVMIKFTSELT